MAKKQRRTGNLATLYDVGRHARVSHITVSRVLNASPNVSDKTRARVLKSMHALGYTPNPDARHLSGSGPARIVFVYAESTQIYINVLLVGALQRARMEGCQIIVRFCQSVDVLQETMDELARTGAEGVLLPAPLCDSEKTLKAIDAAGVPVVLIASACPPADFSSVSINDFEASREVVRHLLATGHRRIGFIKGHPARLASSERYRGYVDCLTDAGIAIEPHQVAQGYDTYRSALDAAEYLLHSGFNPTAIFASNDDMAAATLATALRQGIRVPQDLSVIGFDDIAIATMLRPQITTVRRPISDMAFAAVGVLIEEIRCRRSGIRPPVSHTLLQHSLMVRESSAARKNTKAARKPPR